MLMTRIFAKNFLIDASEKNIDGVGQRARATIDMIAEARLLIRDPEKLQKIDEMDEKLTEYVDQFSKVTQRQAIRQELVLNQLNVIGPETERHLTSVMHSAFADGDVEAAYLAGMTLRTMLLARLYVQRFLIQNDEASNQRVNQELEALDQIGPKVANEVEQLKLSIKTQQDKMGPNAEAAMGQTVIMAVVVSAIAVLFALFSALFIGRGISRPVLQMTSSMRDLASGNLDVEIPAVGQKNEIGQMADAVQVFRKSMVESDRLAGEQQKAELEIRKSRDAAEAANQAKAAFLATMSHEIRTPMNGVIGMVDLLVQTPMNDDQNEMLRTVRSSAYSLLTIINDILDFSKIEAGKLELENIPLSVCEVVEGVAETLAPSALQRGVRLHVHVDPAIPARVTGDPVRIRQILFNIAGNAVKFSEDSRVLLHAKLLASEDGVASVQIKVTDFGIGISEQAQANLFTEFSQAESSTTRQYGGTGLGLSIAKRLTVQMGGEIEVQSALGVGSVFTVTLPLPVADTSEPNREGQIIAGLNILLAMAESDERALTENYLNHWNVNVTAAASLDRLSPAIRRGLNDGASFDLLLLGSSWPLPQQLEQVAELRHDPDFAVLPAVLMTPSRSQSERPPTPNTVFLSADPMQRAGLLRALAAAVGRMSPDLMYEINKIEVPANQPLTVEQAEAQGSLILIAEDNLTNQDVIGRQIRLLGYVCEFTDDGVEALEAEVKRCYDSGMDDFLAKPLEMPKLQAALKKWLPRVKHDSAAGEIPPATVSPSEPPTAPVDLNVLKKLFGDDPQTIREILSDFIGPSRDNVADIQAAFEADAAEEVGKAAHKLKSSARAVGAMELAELCLVLERAGKAGDWKQVRENVPRLHDCMNEVVAWIENQV